MENLNELFRMREGQKQLKKSAEEVHPVTGEEMDVGEYDRTLGEIMQNKTEQERFLNTFCHVEDSLLTEDIVRSLASGTLLNDDQNKFLEKMRGEYNFRCAEIEQVQDMLDTSMIERIGENNANIQQVIGKIGAEKTAGFLGKEFAELAMTNKKEFKKMVTQMRDVHDLDTNERTARINRDVRQALSSHGINDEKYWEATLGGTTSETQENLRKLVVEQYGGFMKTIDFISGNKLSRRSGEKLYKNFENQTAVLKACDEHMKVIGRVLQGTLTQGVNEAIQKAMMQGGEVREKKVENNVNSINDYKQAKDWFEDRPQRWEKYRTDEIKRLGTQDPDALEEMAGRFADSEIQQENKYRATGAFGFLLMLLFGPLNTKKDDIKKSLKKE